MADAEASPATGSDPAGRALHALARAFAIGGGLILAAMTLMETVSVTLRAVGGSPIAGDFELVQIGTAVAVFAFLPYCQLVKGNFIVDFVLGKASARAKASLDALGGLLLGTIASILLWRMTLGGLELRSLGERTVVIGLPIWTAFPPILASLALLVAVSAYVLWRDIRTAGP
jgi:TRAP-type C4-dicarboxylate transport system permease small subunit